MEFEEAREIVQSGLDRRKEDRKIAEQEDRLEQYEQDMIGACNVHCADVKKQRQLEETGRLNKKRLEAIRMAREKALALEMDREEKAVSAVKKYGVSCMSILCLTIFTSLPVWAAITLAFGLVVFPTAYIFRLYVPLEG